MIRRQLPFRVAACLGVSAATLLPLLSGCGGGGGSGEAVVIPEPGTNLTATNRPAEGGTPSSAGPGVTAAPATSQPADTTAPAATVKAEGWGTLKGRVVFNGNVPEPKVLVAKGATDIKDAEICAAQGILAENLVVNPENKGVRHALVYLSRPTAVKPEAAEAAKAAEVEFDQKNCVFIPHVLGVMKGGKIIIKSSDPIGHNVNTKLVNTKFNQAISSGQEIPLPINLSERTPGLVVCDIHPWMQAYWLVQDHPYFAVTDADGNFEIKDVPAGTQNVVVWQEAANYVTKATGEPVNIAPNAETTKEFTIDASKVK